MRVYWPTTLAHLAETLGGETLASGPVTVHAVTPTLRDYYADADPRDLEEELEFVAMTDAAGQSLRLLAGEGDAARPRRCVAALEVADGGVLDGPGGRGSWSAPERSQVVLAGDLRPAQLVSVHVDGEEAEADVRAALAALPAADAGDEDAAFVVENTEGHDLLWYDATEVALLLLEP
ncbi:DUF6912 family protein [Kineococcus gynurae]|uniref:DUF6912 family protein n=1 Tax=Kineococcus gynurae TaxID=452979 RepID=A0ABV5LXC6_9ACTN